MEAGAADGFSNMSKAEVLSRVITEKLTTAAQEIFAAVERTVAGYEEEASGLRQGIDRQRRQLEALLQPLVKLERRDDQLPVCEPAAAGGGAELPEEEEPLAYERNDQLPVCEPAAGGGAELPEEEEPLAYERSDRNELSRKKCPLCNVTYANVSEHVRDVHMIKNTEERRLLLGLKTLKYGGPLFCPVFRCQHASKKFVRLERHLKVVHKVSEKEKRTLVAAAKRKEMKARLDKLRARKSDAEGLESIDAALKNLQAKLSDFQERTSEMEAAMDNVEKRGGEWRRRTRAASKQDKGEKGRAEEAKDQPPKKAVQQVDPWSLEYLLDKFKAFCQRSKHLKSNVRYSVNQTLTRVEGFLSHMWGAVTVPSAHLWYLDNTDRVLDWISMLRTDKDIPTVKNYLTDIRNFLCFVNKENFEQVRLPKSRMLSLDRLLKKEIMVQINKQVAMLRQEVRSEKSKRQLTQQQIASFKKCMAAKIPKALEKLKQDPKKESHVTRCVGMLCAYLFAITGHRRGALASLLADDVLCCDRINDDYVINAKHHKTVDTCGRSRLALTKEEYGWMEDFATLRPRLPGYDSKVPTFFFNSAGGQIEDVGEMVTNVWNSCGVRDVTITLVRSSLSTVAHRLQEEGQSADD